jgi:hypothetical protein
VFAVPDDMTRRMGAERSLQLTHCDLRFILMTRTTHTSR